MNSENIAPLVIAKWLVKMAAEAGDGLTNLKLQKLLYYAQAWYIVLYGKKLFDQDFEAWVHGPAIRPVYGYFKDFSYSPITPERRIAAIPAHVKKHLSDILQSFGGYSAYQLELMTHSEAPWLNARRGLAPDESSRNIISVDDMKKFYSNMRHGKK